MLRTVSNSGLWNLGESSLWSGQAVGLEAPLHPSGGQSQVPSRKQLRPPTGQVHGEGGAPTRGEPSSRSWFLASLFSECYQRLRAPLWLLSTLRFVYLELKTRRQKEKRSVLAKGTSMWQMGAFSSLSEVYSLGINSLQSHGKRLSILRWEMLVTFWAVSIFPSFLHWTYFKIQ